MEIDQEDWPRITGLSTNLGSLPCSRIIFATGIWTSRIVPQFVCKATIPVAHPYIHSCPRTTLHGRCSPFVRYPGSRVYMRDHGSHDGLGSYDHAAVAVDKPGTTGVEPWPSRSRRNKDEIDENNEFDESLHRAYALLPNRNLFAGGDAFNGVFAVTPDNLPLAGKVDGVQGLWVAAAVWVTHAAGTARLVAELVKSDVGVGVRGCGSEGESGISDSVRGRKREGDEQLEVDEEMKRALDPNRFKGMEERVLRELAAWHWVGITMLVNIFHRPLLRRTSNLTKEKRERSILEKLA